MIDIVIAVIPFCRPDMLGGPPQLKSYVKQFGFNCKVLDWNIDLYNEMGKDEFESKENILDTFESREHNLEIFESRESMLTANNGLDDLWSKIIDKYSDKWIAEIKRLKPRFFGLSCFSFLRTKDLVTVLLEKMRKELPDQKIVIGGHAVSCESGCELGVHDNINNSFGRDLFNRKLVDFYINGEGEIPLLKLLNGIYECDGLNNDRLTRVTDLDNLPYADFSDLDMSKYPLINIPVFFSRGCVNNCKFCIRIIKKYITKTPKAFVKELIYYSKLHSNLHQFLFMDSLVSGNRRKYKELIDELFDNKFIRPWMAMHFIWPESYINAETFYKMKHSGVYIYPVGVESGSERVRLEMGKHIKDSSIDFTLEQCFKNKITIPLLLIVGYITETEEDFQMTLDMLDRYAKYAEVILIKVGMTYYISKESQKIHQDEGLDLTFEDGHWVYKDNTIKVRINRWFRLIDKCNELNFELSDPANVGFMKNLSDTIYNKK